MIRLSFPAGGTVLLSGIALVLVLLSGCVNDFPAGTGQEKPPYLADREAYMKMLQDTSCGPGPGERCCGDRPYNTTFQDCHYGSMNGLPSVFTVRNTTLFPRFGTAQLPQCESPGRWIRISFGTVIGPENQISVRSILLSRLKASGARCGDVLFLTYDGGGVSSARVEYDGLDPAIARRVVSSPGEFGLRIQTNASASEAVIGSRDLANVSYLREEPPGSGRYGIPLTLTGTAAQKFSAALITTGAREKPDLHPISFTVDGEIVSSAPLSPDLAVQISQEPTALFFMEVPGKGDQSFARAEDLWVLLSTGQLPVNVTVEDSG